MAVRVFKKSIFIFSSLALFTDVVHGSQPVNWDVREVCEGSLTQDYEAIQKVEAQERDSFAPNPYWAGLPDSIKTYGAYVHASKIVKKPLSQFKIIN